GDGKVGFGISPTLGGAGDLTLGGGNLYFGTTTAQIAVDASYLYFNSPDNISRLHIGKLGIDNRILATLHNNDGSAEFEIRDSGLNEVAHIDSNGGSYFAGSMGIGETSPGAKLEIEAADTDNVTGLLIDQNDTGTSKCLEITNAGTGDSISVPSTDFVVRGNGKVGIGISPTNNLHCYTSNESAGVFSYKFENADATSGDGFTMLVKGGAASSSDSAFEVQETDGTSIFKVGGKQGNITIVGLASSTGTNIGVNSSGKVVKITSSRRYKKNIKDMEIDSNLIYKLRPVSYQYKGSDIDCFGLIAEEVVKLFPKMVPLDDKGRPESVNYSLLGVLLIPEIKKLRNEVDSLRDELKKQRKMMLEIQKKLSMVRK
ncbi:tail fiber domain-containing protein, partial [bacterium]|nr:tail fiber domain-containing protein [bacterium]